jgi:hypothetical protein
MKKSVPKTLKKYQIIFLKDTKLSIQRTRTASKYASANGDRNS